MRFQKASIGLRPPEFLKILQILKITGGIRPETARQSVICFRLIPFSQPVIADTQRNSRQEIIAFLLYKCPAVSFRFQSQRLLIPEYRFPISPSVQKMSSQITADFPSWHIIDKALKQSQKRFLFLPQPIAADGKLSCGIYLIFFPALPVPQKACKTCLPFSYSLCETSSLP